MSVRDDYMHDKPHVDEIAAIHECEKLADAYRYAGKIDHATWAAFRRDMDLRKGAELRSLRMFAYCDARRRFGS
jgi:hypothetical protein